MIPYDKLSHITEQHPYPLLFTTISGAHLYGFASPDSDFDLRGVHNLPLQLLLGLEQGEDTYELANQDHGLDLDLVTHDAVKFFKLMLKNNGYVLEQLYSPLIVKSTPAFEELKEIAKGVITRHHGKHYVGFAQNQWQLYQKESPKRLKPLLYVFRVLLTGIYLMQTGRLEANLQNLNAEFQLPYLPDLMEQKIKGKEKITIRDEKFLFYEQKYLRLLQLLEDSCIESRLPEYPTAHSALNDLLLRIRLLEPAQ